MKTIAFPGVDIPDIPRAVALGIFDGVHIGHRAVITRAVGVEGTVSAVFTFEQPPWALPKDAAWELISPDAKNRVLESLGVEELFRADFAAIRHLSPREFVRDVLRGALHARVVSCGFNYHFGKDGAGNADMLRTLCEEYDIQLRLVEPVQVDALPVSASRIRRFIEQGEVQQAARGVIAKGVDALFIPNDNTVASALPVLAQEAIAAGLPVYPTADSMVRDGGLATVGINYTVLGGQTADMVCRVLEGTPIADIPVELVNESSVVVNGDTAAALGVDVSRYVQ